MKRILVIEREFGAGGATVAEMAARRLGWRLLDHALTEEIARQAKVSTETCQSKMERVDSWGYRLAKVFWRGSHERSVGLPDADIIDADRLVCLTETVIGREAEAGSCVMVGRGAAYFLRERQDTFCVFLYASRELKYQRVLERVKNAEEALRLVDTVDEERKQFIRHYFKVEFPQRHLYHAMLNTAIGMEATVETVVQLMQMAEKAGPPGK